MGPPKLTQPVKGDPAELKSEWQCGWRPGGQLQNLTLHLHLKIWALSHPRDPIRKPVLKTQKPSSREMYVQWWKNQESRWCWSSQRLWTAGIAPSHDTAVKSRLYQRAGAWNPGGTASAGDCLPPHFRERRKTPTPLCPSSCPASSSARARRYHPENNRQARVWGGLQGGSRQPRGAEPLKCNLNHPRKGHGLNFLTHSVAGEPPFGPCPAGLLSSGRRTGFDCSWLWFYSPHFSQEFSFYLIYKVKLIHKENPLHFLDQRTF